MLNRFIQFHHIDALSMNGSEVSILWPEQEFYFTGYITNSDEIHVVSEVVPTVTMTILLIDDLISTKTDQTSHEGSFEEFYHTTQEYLGPDGFRPPLTGSPEQGGNNSTIGGVTK